MGKVKLQKPYTTKVIKVPGIEGAELVVKSSLLLGDMSEELEKGTEGERAAALLAALIESWNFIDDDDKDVEISVDVVKKYFTADQMRGIFAEITEFAQAVKKG